MPAKTISNARRNAIVRDAIAHAEKTVGTDGRAFVEALRGHALSKLPAASPNGSNARSMVLPGGRRLREPTGARLTDDPRYLRNVRELAQRTKRNARIIGGSTVAAKDFVDCVAVGDDDDWGCTGTLIAPNAVLTAGHCKKLHTRIWVGTEVDRRGKEYAVTRHVRHPDWTKGLKNDVMLLVLAKRVKGVKPRALAPSKVIDAATNGRAVGFGTTDLAGTVGYGLKQQVDVPIVSNACKGTVKGEKDGAVYGCHLGIEIVAGKPFLNRDSCRGDSGGPLYVAHRGGWLLAGVTSRGTDLGITMCGDGGLYTRVDKYASWIGSVLR
jgi:secreted trypsin-like serine protease